MPPASSFTIPAMTALTPQDEASLSEMIERIYQHCRAHHTAPIGRAYMTWDMDLRARSFAVRAEAEATAEKLERWTFTPHMNEQQVEIGAAFAFCFADRVEELFLAQPVGFRGLQPYLTGNEFERVFPGPEPEPIRADEWDLWGGGLTAAISRHYEREIYPRVIETLLAASAREPRRGLVVADVGGGSGRLAEMICERLTGPSGVARVVLLERSEPLLRAAEARAAKYPGHFVVRKADVTADGFLDTLGESPDAIVLCGVVAQQVLGRAQGLRVMQACHAKLAPGALALVPSYSPSLLSSRDYEAMGFFVHNKSLHVIEGAGPSRALKTNDFYVLEKR